MVFEELNSTAGRVTSAQVYLGDDVTLNKARALVAPELQQDRKAVASPSGEEGVGCAGGELFTSLALTVASGTVDVRAMYTQDLSAGDDPVYREVDLEIVPAAAPCPMD